MPSPAWLTATLALLTNVLVLTTGERIAVAGEAVEKDGRVIFRNLEGRLFSLSSSDVDFPATKEAGAERARPPAPPPAPVLRLKRSESERRKAFAELEAKHAPAGSTPTSEEIRKRLQVPDGFGEPPSDPAEEWAWRNRARSHEEAVRRARENRDLLVAKAEALEARIRSLVGLGYKANQFSYDTTQLQDTLSQIPYAELEITRAERAMAEFRDEARRRGVLPGWLR